MITFVFPRTPYHFTFFFSECTVRVFVKKLHKCFVKHELPCRWTSFSWIILLHILVFLRQLNSSLCNTIRFTRKTIMFFFCFFGFINCRCFIYTSNSPLCNTHRALLSSRELWLQNRGKLYITQYVLPEKASH